MPRVLLTIRDENYHGTQIILASDTHLAAVPSALQEETFCSVCALRLADHWLNGMMMLPAAADPELCELEIGGA